MQAQAVAGQQNGQVHVVEPDEPHLALARWLIAHEMNALGAALAEPEAAERACRKLLERLAKLITPRGSQALLTRAEYLARADLTADDADLLGTLVGLVALFIGEHLMARMVLEVWPDAPLLKASQPNAGL
jgi:hypothetical protein